MEQLLQCLGLCTSLSLFTPRDLCILRCTCKSLQAVPVSWLEYKHRVDIPVSKSSAYCWLRTNVPNIKFLSLDAASEQQLHVLLQNAKALAALSLYDCNTSTLPTFPQHLERLYMQGCHDLAALPGLPSSLKVLTLYWCRGLKQLPPLLGTVLQEIWVYDCQAITELPSLPGTLKQLKCSHLKIRRLPTLPTGLNSLHLDRCLQLQVLPDMPCSLTAMTLYYCTSLEQLPSLRHTAITVLAITSCVQLQLIQTLPASIQSLSLTDLPLLRQLPPLPQSLAHLVVYWNPALQQLPALPLHLTSLLSSR
eukprot:GHUV01026713.1.p1 GENE.GHUV01026713.1~~GHUV01026713.1.p1  ORF type:complete len:307 (+),score=36.27 GHUV01026713.1:120-1040(+)